MSRVYNFSDPSDLWKEINIYKGLELIPDINFYKSFTKIEVKEKTVNFLWFFTNTIRNKYETSFKNVFVKDEREILSVKNELISGSDGRDYYLLTDDKGKDYTVTLDADDRISPIVNKCRVYGYPVQVELIGYSESNNESVYFNFTFKDEMRNFLKWIRDFVIKNKTTLFESIHGEIYTLKDSEIDKIVDNVFKEK